MKVCGELINVTRRGRAGGLTSPVLVGGAAHFGAVCGSDLVGSYGWERVLLGEAGKEAGGRLEPSPFSSGNNS